MHRKKIPSSKVFRCCFNRRSCKKSKAINRFDCLGGDIRDGLKNIEQLINGRISEKENFKKERDNIKTIIKDTREKIITRLEELENKLRADLKSKCRILKGKNKNALRTFENAQKELRKHHDSTIQMQQTSPDVHCFLATHQINDRVRGEMSSITKTAVSVENYKMEIELHPYISKLLKELEGVDVLGKISVEEKMAGLQINDASLRGAQSLRSPSVSIVSSVSETRLSLKQNFKVKQTREDINISGCAMSPNGNILLTNYTSAVVMEYSVTGQHIKSIAVSEPPFDVTAVDTDCIAVTYGDWCQYTELINVAKQTEKKQIDYQKSCWGICHWNGKCYVLIHESGVAVFDILGEKLKTIKLATSIVDYLVVTDNRIFYADYGTSLVYCCDMEGKKVWEFKDIPIRGPTGISVNNYKNVFVASYHDHNLSVIQHDGKSSKTLLNDKTECKKPRPIHFNLEKKLLIVCNEKDGQVDIYTVI
ncbi:Hypothetical predicted protein [Mytilus galloprovincialis]|uniref:Uncharacterized protein n=1 Tax=Mytilus galloprovincialis TaxID=29158 RepID=A0A8B6HSL5_MYTGA|nr:Hypothetical predicted protein [Mytilus galloprovincialis]